MIGRRKRKKLAGELAQDLPLIVFLVQVTARLSGQKAVPLFFAGDFLNAKGH
jgi:hypothetical protein